MADEEDNSPWYKKLAKKFAPGKLVQAQTYTTKTAETQYDKDMQLPLAERLKKVQKGFEGKD